MTAVAALIVLLWLFQFCSGSAGHGSGQARIGTQTIASQIKASRMHRGSNNERPANQGNTGKFIFYSTLTARNFRADAFVRAR